MVICDICGEPVLDGPVNKKRHAECRREFERQRVRRDYHERASDPEYRAAKAAEARKRYAKRHLVKRPKPQIGDEERARRLARDRAARRRWMAELMADPVRYEDWRRRRSEYLARWRAALTPEQRAETRKYLLEWKRARAIADIGEIAARLEGAMNDE